jgi:hypothetical protein
LVIKVKHTLVCRYNSSGEAEAVTIVDMQVYRLAPPITDVLMFIYLNATRELRAQVTERLLSDYWHALQELTLNAGCKLPQEMRDLDTMKMLASEFKIFGLAAAGGYVPMCQLPPEARERDASSAAEGEHDFDVLKDFLNSRGEQVIRGMNMSGDFMKRIEDAIEELFDHIGI